MEEPEEKQEEEKKELVAVHEEEVYEETVYPDEWGDVFQDAREYLKKGNIDAAQEALDSVEERGAEWHFLYSQVFKEKHWFLESRNSLQEAIKLDPENKIYKKELKKLDRMAKKGKRRRHAGNMGAGEACLGGCGECCATVCCTAVCEGLCSGCN